MFNELDDRKEVLIQLARKMLVAARTAPKARGTDNLEMAILTDNDIRLLALEMRRIGETQQNEIFLRDSENVLKGADVVLLIGTKIQALGLKLCGLCGFKDCAEKNQYPDVPCAFNTGDLGIAIGSAVGIAMDNRVDNRIMYTLGYAAKSLGVLGKDVRIVYGIPLSATSKNPFFDRK